jgi:4'-phosphopantetheinyl transferase
LIPKIEFNVSHQASFVALAGCIIPPSPSIPEPIQRSPADTAAAVFSTPQPSSAPIPSIPQVGIDITCVDEPGRRSRENTPKTAKALSDFVDIFAEVFSRRELDIIKQIPSSASEQMDIETAVASRLRVFYAYWALKEAYIKMTGEALLAPWLRELEFTDVVTPDPVENGSPTAPWSEPYTDVQTWLYGKAVEDVRIELVAFEKDYLVATAARGGLLACRSHTDEAKDTWMDLEAIDIERDISHCARGECECLN